MEEKTKRRMYCLVERQIDLATNQVIKEIEYKSHYKTINGLNHILRKLDICNEILERGKITHEYTIKVVYELE